MRTIRASTKRHINLFENITKKYHRNQQRRRVKTKRNTRQRSRKKKKHTLLAETFFFSFFPQSLVYLRSQSNLGENARQILGFRPEMRLSGKATAREITDLHPCGVTRLWEHQPLPVIAYEAYDLIPSVVSPWCPQRCELPRDDTKGVNVPFGRGRQKSIVPQLRSQLLGRHVGDSATANI